MVDRPHFKPSSLGELNFRRDREPRTGKNKKNCIRLAVLTSVFLIFAAILVFVTLPDMIVKRPAPQITALFSITGLNKPLTVDVDAAGRIFVGDSGNKQVSVYDANGRLISRIGGPKTAVLKSVFGVAADEKAGNVYVSDWVDQSIRVFNMDGRRKKTFEDLPGFSPFGMVLRRNNLYVAGSDGIYLFYKDGRLKKRIGSRGSAPGEFNFPTAIAVGADGAMYVADQLNGRVVALSPAGKVKWVLGRPAKPGAPGFFALPRGLALDAKRDRLYVSDTFLNRIVVLDTEGRLTGHFGKRGQKEGLFDFPEGLAVDKSGRLYVADRENNRVQVLSVGNLSRPSKQLKRRWRQFFFTEGD